MNAKQQSTNPTVTNSPPKGETFVLVVALPDLLAVGFIAFVVAPYLFAEPLPQLVHTILAAKMLEQLVGLPRERWRSILTWTASNSSGRSKTR